MDRPIYDYSSLAARRTREFASQSGQKMQQVAQDQFKIWIEQLGGAIKENPGVSLGVAMGMGVVLGWLIKRR
jgi:ElaB/YqjD/DUF883 family membrane-anchored ribosome-binding protein